jgi:hypothetical protein
MLCLRTFQPLQRLVLIILEEHRIGRDFEPPSLPNILPTDPLLQDPQRAQHVFGAVLCGAVAVAVAVAVGQWGSGCGAVGVGVRVGLECVDSSE